MMSQLGRLPTAAALQRVTAESLGDPGLRLAFRNPGSLRWVGVGGEPTHPPAPGSGRAWREVRSDGAETRAGLAYDEFLDEDPELLDAAASAVRLSLHTRHLEDELRLSTETGVLPELTDDERRRIERDLHDGAQQRLVVIGMDLERLRQDLPPEAGAASAELSRLGDEVDRALDEIREIAHGAFPPVLADLGLRAALAEAVRGNAQATLRVDGLARHSQIGRVGGLLRDARGDPERDEARGARRRDHRVRLGGAGRALVRGAGRRSRLRPGGDRSARRVGRPLASPRSGRRHRPGVLCARRRHRRRRLRPDDLSALSGPRARDRSSQPPARP